MAVAMPASWRRPAAFALLIVVPGALGVCVDMPMLPAAFVVKRDIWNYVNAYTLESETGEVLGTMKESLSGASTDVTLVKDDHEIASISSSMQNPIGPQTTKELIIKDCDEVLIASVFETYSEDSGKHYVSYSIKDGNNTVAQSAKLEVGFDTITLDDTTGANLVQLWQRSPIPIVDFTMKWTGSILAASYTQTITPALAGKALDPRVLALLTSMQFHQGYSYFGVAPLIYATLVLLCILCCLCCFCRALCGRKSAITSPPAREEFMTKVEEAPLAHESAEEGQGLLSCVRCCSRQPDARRNVGLMAGEH